MSNELPKDQRTIVIEGTTDFNTRFHISISGNDNATVLMQEALDAYYLVCNRPSNKEVKTQIEQATAALDTIKAQLR